MYFKICPRLNHQIHPFNIPIFPQTHKIILVKIVLAIVKLNLELTQQLDYVAIYDILVENLCLRLRMELNLNKIAVPNHETQTISFTSLKLNKLCGEHKYFVLKKLRTISM